MACDVNAIYWRLLVFGCLRPNGSSDWIAPKRLVLEPFTSYRTEFKKKKLVDYFVKFWDFSLILKRRNIDSARCWAFDRSGRMLRTCLLPETRWIHHYDATDRVPYPLVTWLSTNLHLAGATHFTLCWFIHSNEFWKKISTIRLPCRSGFKIRNIPGGTTGTTSPGLTPTAPRCRNSVSSFTGFF